MIAVIFEVQPHPEQKAAYLDAAATLRPHLDRIDGVRACLVFIWQVRSPGNRSDTRRSDES